MLNVNIANILIGKTGKNLIKIVCSDNNNYSALKPMPYSSTLLKTSSFTSAATPLHNRGRQMLAGV